MILFFSDVLARLCIRIRLSPGKIKLKKVTVVSQVVTRVGPLLSSFKSLQENNPAKKMEKAANGMSFKNFKNR